MVGSDLLGSLPSAKGQPKEVHTFGILWIPLKKMFVPCTPVISLGMHFYLFNKPPYQSSQRRLRPQSGSLRSSHPSLHFGRWCSSVFCIRSRPFLELCQARPTSSHFYSHLNIPDLISPEIGIPLVLHVRLCAFSCERISKATTSALSCKWSLHVSKLLCARVFLFWDLQIPAVNVVSLKKKHKILDHGMHHLQRNGCFSTQHVVTYKYRTWMYFNEML